MDNCPAHVVPPDLLALKRLLSGTNGNSSVVSPGSTMQGGTGRRLDRPWQWRTPGPPPSAARAARYRVTPKSGPTDVADDDQARLGDRADADAGARSRSRLHSP